MLIQLWFDKTHQTQLQYIGKGVKAIDDKIQNLWLPNIISRVPRCIEYQLGAWKGTEICSFLLFYSIPILFDCLPQDYQQHYILLVELMFLLLKDSISYEELAKASCMLKHFCDFCYVYIHYMEKDIIHVIYIIYSIVHILFVSWVHYGCSQHFVTKITMVIIKTCSTVPKMKHYKLLPMLLLYRKFQKFLGLLYQEQLLTNCAIK